MRAHLTKIATHPRKKSSSSTAYKHIIELICVPVLQNFAGHSSLPLNNTQVVKGVYENCIRFLPEIVGGRNSIIKGNPNQTKIQPLASVVPYAVYFQFGSNLWHEDGALNFEFVTAVSNALSVITRTCCHYSSCLLFFSQIEESSPSPSQFKAPNVLQILSFDEYIRLIFL